ncbi:hypothetical protein FE633_42990 [Streptomyces montanus]|uniref:Uncharacterized protein n=1 Tax=Streptomyces montanus TaxID=2580423 RepID=A0A5R9FCI2_9ACTN|nr:hypothetical protein [Streptomyces montanus]TLS40189.1 hypothetical protein FE633_42990 [Streptomyces montanus]
MADTHPPENVRTSWDVPDLPGQVLTASAGSRLFLLPDTTLDGVGIYRDDAAGLVKTMRHQGMDIDFALPREDRRYLSEYGAIDVVAVIAVAVAGNLSTDVLKSIGQLVWHRARSALGGGCTPQQVDSAPVTVKAAEVTRNGDEIVIRGLEVSGRAADIEGLLRNALSAQDPTALPPAAPDATGEADTPE